MPKVPSHLKEYSKKRDFDKSPEPKPKIKKTKKKLPIFVVQKHDASHLHYDLRLEIDGVLKSWAVPKGPSMNQNIKRLAIETEDHPIDYGSFEGIIPKGQYGGGTVMIWDTGSYENLKAPKSMKETYKEGTIEVFLKGKKLKGGFVLVHTGFGNFPKKNWLLKKINDEKADETVDITKKDKSAVTGKKLDTIAKEGNAKIKTMKKKVKHFKNELKKIKSEKYK